MMNSVGTKLSKHVLGMKFMRKTKAQVDQDKTEQKFRKHYAAPAEGKKTQGDIKSQLPSAEASTSSTNTCIIEEVGSYSQCEEHIFGRQSFGGFNPVLEQNVRKGIWRPFYMDPAIIPEEEVELKEEEEDGETDVTNEQMAKTFGSLVGTLGKRFMKKKNRNDGGGGDQDGRPPKSKKMKMDPENEQGGKKRSKWKNFFKGGGKKSKNNQQDDEGQQQHDSEQSGSGNKNGGKGKGKKRPQNSPPAAKTPPPNKKRKFMKPSDD